MTTSLEQALSARDAVTTQLNALNAAELTNSVVDNMNLQQKASSLLHQHFAIVVYCNLDTYVCVDKMNNFNYYKTIMTDDMYQALINLKM